MQFTLNHSQFWQYMSDDTYCMTHVCVGVGFQEKWAEEYADLISLNFLMDCIHMLNPENEDRVVISDWFACQLSVAKALKCVLNSEVRSGKKTLAEEAASEVLREYLYVYACIYICMYACILRIVYTCIYTYMCVC